MISRKGRGARTDKLKCVLDNCYETAVVGTEYFSPKQHGGIYGTVYRQYFTTSLPTDLTSGNNVAQLIDCTLRAYDTLDRYTARGLFKTTSLCIKQTGEAGKSNLVLILGVPFVGLINGWVEYTK